MYGRYGEVTMYAWYWEGDDVYMYGIRRVKKYAWYGKGYVCRWFGEGYDICMVWG